MTLHDILTGSGLTGLVSEYGYWAVFVMVALESMGVPVPGETVLVAAAVYAGTTHQLDISLVVLVASAGAISGDNLGFLVGREIGMHLLRRYGPYVGLDRGRLRLGQWLFLRHGAKIVFFGRFVALLRALAAVLAGANGMRWPRFLLYNALGGTAWATVFGTGGYLLGGEVHRYAGPLGALIVAGAVIGIVVGFLFVRHHERRLTARAERELEEAGETFWIPSPSRE